MREYKNKITPDPDNDIYTIKQWNETVKLGIVSNMDGCGYWVKNGFESRDEVFNTPQLDATHVIWYNK